MNTDLSRVHSQNTQVLKQFATTESLQCTLNHSSSAISHTYSSFSFDTYSNIDHFITTDSLFHAIQSYTTCDDMLISQIIYRCLFLLTLNCLGQLLLVLTLNVPRGFPVSNGTVPILRIVLATRQP